MRSLEELNKVYDENEKTHQALEEKLEERLGAIEELLKKEVEEQEVPTETTQVGDE